MNCIELREDINKLRQELAILATVHSSAAAGPIRGHGDWFRDGRRYELRRIDHQGWIRREFRDSHINGLLLKTALVGGFVPPFCGKSI